MRARLAPAWAERERGDTDMFSLFPLGQIVATPGVLAALERAKQRPTCFLARHAIGDWGELEPADVAENEYSVAHGFRLLERPLQKPMTEPAQGEMSPAMPEAVAKTNATKKMRQVLP